MLQSFARCAGAPALVVALTLTALPASAAPPASAAVTIGNFTFAPATLTIPAGATVTWANGDDIPHTVAAVDKSFRSKVLDTGDHYSFTFAKAGTYEYFCSIHPHMTGKIVVK